MSCQVINLGIFRDLAATICSPDVRTSNARVFINDFQQAVEHRADSNDPESAFNLPAWERSRCLARDWYYANLMAYAARYPHTDHQLPIITAESMQGGNVIPLVALYGAVKAIWYNASEDVAGDRHTELVKEMENFKDFIAREIVDQSAEYNALPWAERYSPPKELTHALP